jgi:hypothetical protein
MTTICGFLALTGVGLRLPALAAVGVAVAIIRTLVVLLVIRLQQRPPSPPENTQ